MNTRIAPITSLPVGRRNRVLLTVMLLLLLAGVLWAARGALFPFVFALVMAYLMLPFVNRIDVLLRRRMPSARWTRPIAILAVYLVTIALIVLFFVLVVPVVSSQFQVLWDSREELVAGGERLVVNILEWYRQTIPETFRTQIEDGLRQAGGTVLRALQSGIVGTFGVVTSTVSFLIGMFVVPFWLGYVLNDQSRVTRGAIGLVPSRYRDDFVNVLRISDTIMGAYLRGQLLLCVFIGVMATAGLMLLGVRFPAVLGLIAGIFEILPFIGPFIGLVPAVLVAAIQDPILGLWTALLFLAIQQVENLFLVPRISGKAVELHPAIIMVVLVIGNQVAGLAGMILAVPVTAIVRDVSKYFYLRFQDDPVAPRKALAQLQDTPLQLDV